MHARRLALSGVAFVALALAAVVAVGGSTPASSDSAAEIARFYSENEMRHFIMPFAFAATVPLLVLFAVGLARIVGARAGRSGAWGQVVVAGATLVGAVILMAAAIHFALVEAATGDDVAPGAVTALSLVEGSTWVAFSAGFGVMMLGAAGLLLTAGVMRRFGWIALVIGVAAFIPVADFFALLATLAWIVVTSVVLARKQTEPAGVATPGASYEGATS